MQRNVLAQRLKELTAITLCIMLCASTIFPAPPAPQKETPSMPAPAPASGDTIEGFKAQEKQLADIMEHNNAILLQDLAKISLDGAKEFLKEPRPQDPELLKGWEEQKAEYQQIVAKNMTQLIKDEEQQYDERLSEYLNSPGHKEMLDAIAMVTSERSYPRSATDKTVEKRVMLDIQKAQTPQGMAALKK